MQAIPFSACGTQGTGLIAVGVSQILEVIAATGNGVLLLRAVYIVVIRADAFVALPIRLQVAVLVAVLTGEGDMARSAPLAVLPLPCWMKISRPALMVATAS
ncbi:hypothetical protein [Pseudomonas luteola]|uniref:hypothetical protein n=1 Tax=Pseudomonas luteola TaxID=47886 RepID=UPI003CC785DD